MRLDIHHRGETSSLTIGSPSRRWTVGAAIGVLLLATGVAWAVDLVEFGEGELIVADDFNDNFSAINAELASLRADYEALQAETEPLGDPSIGAVHYVQETGTDIASGTALPFSTKVLDDGDYAESLAGKWTYTAPADGVYLISAGIRVDADSAGSMGQATLRVEVDSTTERHLATFAVPAGWDKAVWLGGADSVALEKGAKVTLTVYHEVPGADAVIVTSASGLHNRVTITPIRWTTPAE